MEISFSDNGIGIKENDLSQLFSKFRRVDERKNSIEGAGIGLYLVKKIVENSGGEVSVHSEFGKGSFFKVYINQIETEILE